MRVLSFGTDKNIFNSESAVFARQCQYAERFDALDIVVPAKNDYTRKVEGNISIIPTQTNSKVRGFFALLRLGLSTEKPSVITVQDPFEIGFAGYIVAMMRSVPLHVQVHTDFLSSGFVRHSFMNRFRKLLALFVLRRATRVRVVLASLKERLEAQGVVAPITVLPIFVDVSRFGSIERTRDPRFSFSVLCIGRLTSEKNFSLALEAVKRARAEQFDVGLTIVGDGPLRSALETQVQDLGLIGRVEFVGQVGDITPYLRRADAVLVPSKYEGYGLVIVEALAAGVPVIATDVGVAREAGAVVAGEHDFVTTFVAWLKNGRRSTELSARMYENETEYIARYTADIAACLE